MSICRILLPINERDQIAPMAGIAFALAELFNAEVQGFFPQRSFAEEFWFPGEGASALQIQQLYDEAQRNAQKHVKDAETSFNRHAEGWPHIRKNFVSSEGRIEEESAKRAMASDLVVIGNRNDFDSQFWRNVCDGVLVYAGRPIIVAPSQETGGALGSTLIIAWKEGVEAARALAAAKPFFGKANQIFLVTVGADDVENGSAERIKHFIELSGFHAEIKHLELINRSVGQTLVNYASECEGALLVMGAYSHSRWRERALGGVTEYVMHETRIPVFMVH